MVCARKEKNELRIKPKALHLVIKSMPASATQPHWLQDLQTSEGLRRERAYAAMMAEWHMPVYSFLRSMLGDHDDAADATQDCFIQVLRSISGFRGESKFSTWLYTIARRKGLDALRSRKQLALRHAHPDAFHWESKLQSDPYFDGDDLERKLHAAVQSLPARQREVFVLRYFQALPYAEIAELTGTSEGAAKASFFHAKGKIQNELIAHAD